MRRFMALAAFLTWSVGAAQPFPDPRVVRLNDRVHVLLGPIQHANPANQGYMINSAVIVGDRGVVLVDSGSSAEVGRHIAAAVRRITEKPVTHVVNTHPHGDHYLGNAAFDGATIVASHAGAHLMEREGGDWLDLMRRDIGSPLPGTRVVLPSTTHSPGRTETRLEGMRMIFWVPKGSHTAGDLMVYLPDDGVLIAGDILVNGVVPTLQDGFLSNWIETLDAIALLGDIKFVPGHGAPMRLEDVLALRASLTRFRDGVRAGYARGLSEAEVRKTLDLAEWERLERPYVINRNINRAWLEAERESF